MTAVTDLDQMPRPKGRKRTGLDANPVLRWLYNAYERVVRVTVKRAGLTVACGAAVVIAAFVLAVVAFYTLVSSFLSGISNATQSGTGF